MTCGCLQKNPVPSYNFSIRSRHQNLCTRCQFTESNVTRLGDFYKLFGNKVSHKNSPKISLFGLFLIMSLLCKKCLATFWPIFGEIRQLFIHLVTLLHTRSNVSLFEASERMFRGCSSFFSKVFFLRDNRARD